MEGKRFRHLVEDRFHIFVAWDRNVPLHGHDFLEFSYVAKGAMVHRIDGKQSTLQVGDYFIVDYGVEHTYSQVSEEPLQVINLLFYPDFLEQTLVNCRRFEDVVNTYLLRFSYKTLKTSPTGKTFHDDDGRIRNALEEMLEEYKSKGYGYIEYIRCLFLETLIQTMRKIGKREQIMGKSDVVAEITNYVKLHYAEKLCLSELAEKYNYSTSYLSRKFAEETGVGFSEYVQKTRIEQCCHLMRSEDLRIGEIAGRVGYGDMKFFYKVFKKTLGLTPREFRKTLVR